MITNPTNHGGLLCNDKGMTLIPQDTFELQLRILVIAHFRRGGHPGCDARHQAVAAHFYLESLWQDVATFVNFCLLCMATTGGRRVPRPMAHAIHAKKRKKVIHFDFLLVVESRAVLQHIRLIKDDPSSFVRIHATSEADSYSAATCLNNLLSIFEVVHTWMSDQGAQFWNNLISEINFHIKLRRHFLTTYCTQSNGTAEVVFRETLWASNAFYRIFEWILQIGSLLLPWFRVF